MYKVYRQSDQVYVLSTDTLGLLLGIISFDNTRYWTLGEVNFDGPHPKLAINQRDQTESARIKDLCFDVPIVDRPAEAAPGHEAFIKLQFESLYVQFARLYFGSTVAPPWFIQELADLWNPLVEFLEPLRYT